MTSWCLLSHRNFCFSNYPLSIGDHKRKEKKSKFSQQRLVCTFFARKFITRWRNSDRNCKSSRCADAEKIPSITFFRGYSFGCEKFLKKSSFERKKAEPEWWLSEKLSGAVRDKTRWSFPKSVHSSFNFPSVEVDLVEFRDGVVRKKVRLRPLVRLGRRVERHRRRRRRLSAFRTNASHLRNVFSGALSADGPSRHPNLAQLPQQLQPVRAVHLHHLGSDRVQCDYNLSGQDVHLEL